MNDENLTGQETTSEPEYQNEQLSNSEAMSGVITAPGETFETIANTPKKTYWLLPVIIFIVINLISTFLFMSDKELVTKTMDKQTAIMREKFDQNVKDGKMTQEDANKAMESMNPAGIFFKGIAYGGAAIGPFIMLLLLSVVYLIGLKVMKAQFDFTNILNVVGLAMIIIAVGNLLSMVISIIKGDMSSVGLGLLFSE
ncbi:MAG: Yip1 family protein, partial [bacterium]